MLFISVKDRAISGKFWSSMVLSTTYVALLKNLDFSNFGCHLEFWRKLKRSFTSKL